MLPIPRHIGFGSTPNFQNLYKQVQRHYTSASLTDAERAHIETLEGSEIEDYFKARKATLLPTLTFHGSEKLHGENMAVCYSNNVLWVQGRNNIRTVIADQNGMAHFVESNRIAWMALINILKAKHHINSDTHTMILDCEFAGGTIQRGNAACSGTDKAAYLFDYIRVVNNETTEETLYNCGVQSPGNGIYSIQDFKKYSVTLDFNKPKECEKQLEELALHVEANSPIATYFNKPDNVGEGVYFHCIATDEHPTFRLKAKGTKHGGKPKIKRDRSGPTSEEDKALSKLADKLTPEWRITQGITETKASSMQNTGALLKWVAQDILKEEVPTIVASGFEFKQVQGYVAKIVKDYFVDYLKDY